MKVRVMKGGAITVDGKKAEAGAVVDVHPDMVAALVERGLGERVGEDAATADAFGFDTEADAEGLEKKTDPREPSLSKRKAARKVKE